VAGSVRARHLLDRRIGRDRALRLASAASLEDALAALAGTAYGREVRPGMDLAEAQRAIAATALWHMRVLAGWLPPGGVEAARALAGWFEIANVEDRLRYLAGRRTPAPFALGALAAAWPAVAGAQSAAEVRAELVGSAWGDPGTDDPTRMGLALRISWARRVIRDAPEAASWAVAAAALLLARELVVAGRPAAPLVALRPPGVGSAWPRATSPAALRELLPPEAARALAGWEDPGELWRAEAAWWRDVERDAGRLARGPGTGRATVVGCVALLAADARRTAGALEAAARAGAPSAREVVEEIG
jgi:hypothetical protein